MGGRAWKAGGFYALSLVVTPIQLLIWRALWSLLTLYITSGALNPRDNDTMANGLIVSGVGFVLRCCMEVTQHELGDVIESMERRMGHGPLAKLITRTISYVYIR